MTASGYNDGLTETEGRNVGAWFLEWGRLPDGRYAVDHYSAAAPAKQRLYFDNRTDARKHWRNFGRSYRAETLDETDEAPRVNYI